MKRIQILPFLFIAFAYLFGQTCSAQDSSSAFLADGNVWTYAYWGYNTYPRKLCSLSYCKYYVNGTRELNGKAYKEIWRQLISRFTYDYDFSVTTYAPYRTDGVDPFLVDETDDVSEPKYFFSLREEAGKVFANIAEMNTLQLMNLKNIDQPVQGLFPVEGDEYVIFDFEHTTSERVIPYVGNKRDIFPIYYVYAPNGITHSSELNLFYRGDELVYKNPNFVTDPFFADVLRDDASTLPMFPAGRSWHYMYEQGGEGNWRDVEATEDWVASDEEATIDGMVYQKLRCSACPQEVFYVRQDGGKVFLHKDPYLKLLESRYPEEKAFYTAQGADEAEVLLYDFTLEEGDPYPCKGEVTVSEVSWQMTLDGKLRKVMVLSNGCKIVEGIGCINSLGTLLYYQNWQPSTPQRRAILYLCGHVKDPSTAIDPVVDEVTYYLRTQEPDLVSINAPLAPEIVNRKSVNSNCFDLSGRRLATPPARGLYIRDGKIVGK